LRIHRILPILALTAFSVLAAEAKPEARQVLPQAYVLFCDGVDLELEGKYADAIQKLEKAQALDPKSSSILYEIGFCYYRTAKNTEAIDYIKRSLAIEPQYGPAHEVLAFTYKATGKSDEALRELEAAAKSAIPPRNHENLISRIAWIYERQGDHRKAIGWYRYLIETGYRRRDTLATLGVLELKEGLYEDAFEAFRQVVRMTPSDEATVADLARAYGELPEKERTEAVRRTEAAAAKSPGPEGQEVLAMAYQAAGREEDMLRALASAAMAASRRASAQKEYLAERFEELGDYPRAVEWRRKMLQDQKKPSADGLARIADLYFKNEQMPEAAKVYREALAAEPGRRDLLRRVADCDAQLYQWDKAAAVLEEYRQGKTLDPNDAEPLYELGVMYDRAGKKDQAAAAKQQAYDLLNRAINKPDSKLSDTKIYLDLAELYYADNKPDKALGCLLVVHHLEPDDAKRVLLLATGYKRVQNWREAAALCQRYLEKDPRSVTSVGALAELAQCEEALGRFDEANAARERARRLLLAAYKATENANAKAALQAQLGEMELKQNHLQDAIRYLQTAIQDNPKQPLLHLLLASAHEGLGDWLLAATQYKSYLSAMGPKVDDDDAPNLYRLGVAQTRAGQAQAGRENKARAIQILTATLDTLDKEKRGIPSHKAQVYRELASFYATEKQYDKALDAAQRAIALAPPSKRASYDLALASLYDDVKRHDDSEKILLAAYQREPNNPAVLNHLGYFYAERNRNLDQAVDLIKKALHHEPLNGAYLDSLGWAYYQQGKNQEALDLLVRAAAYEPDAVILDHVGDAYARLGKIQEAREAWRRALRHDPDVEGVAEKLKKSEAPAPSQLPKPDTTPKPPDVQPKDTNPKGTAPTPKDAPK